MWIFLLQNVDLPPLLTRGGLEAEMEENVYDNQKARELLESLGIPSYLRGYQMTLLALEYVAEDPRRIHAVRKEIFPAMAERLKCGSTAVEGAIRRTSERAWKTNPDMVRGFCGEKRNSKQQPQEFLWALYQACCK